MIYLITGGQRSGKSSYGQQLALSLTDAPVYIATARVWDDDFEARVERHQEDRDERWTTLEIEKAIGNIDLEGEVLVVDCITLWLTNFFVDTDHDIGRSMELAKKELQKLFATDNTLILITNEIGMGTHAPTESGRKFADMQGWMNQFIAEQADEVTLMVSGLPVKVKE
ncbi:bifunctional adenosylcobinamide kinase/adenosylcobinamide-phosphate guanylyltransferase [Fodinibius salsisoli]|uniref:Adenosylcobinamide kinase n=1 Tax=Fodinibius salsisoli TaxID=2820877 RepID=A0ABT3PQF0_9BACT|nr:bifunctional adenosylcobinamide kinase/adenosylcobinamide-phosphate guanylyltransferase [Fodinibius salsisoli]MCW9708060.1 bifunctional adenosylcobinamide kinase/adenosylcobinamide-phosphate guanylyltransferase [Fodinibius salsisoli]